jgi:hypothetical protein
MHDQSEKLDKLLSGDSNIGLKNYNIKELGKILKVV